VLSLRVSIIKYYVNFQKIDSLQLAVTYRVFNISHKSIGMVSLFTIRKKQKNNNPRNNPLKNILHYIHFYYKIS